MITTEKQLMHIVLWLYAVQSAVWLRMIRRARASYYNIICVYLKIKCLKTLQALAFVGYTDYLCT